MSSPRASLLLSGSVAPQTATAVSVLVALAAVVADALTDVNVVFPLVYGIPLVLAAWSRSPRYVWGLALTLMALTFAVTYLMGQVPLEGTAGVVLANRALSALEILVIAGLVHLWIRTEQALVQQRERMEQQNAELERANQELGQREEEIVRQNEELQAQTEELERQSEELRITNEELAARERMLEQLLELSRSLTTELERDAMLKKICEALGLLTDGLPSAILERQGEELTIPCHHGFGPDGLEAERLPYDQSFASLILSLGQTGYLEDLRLRPDLRVPQPRAGEPLRAVLSAPLRVRGQGVGTIEVYAPQRQAWSENQIALIESLGAQASISLQSAELFETIKQERRRFEAVFRTVPFGLLVADDPEGAQMRFNPSGAALFGLPQDENVAPLAPAGQRLRRSLFRNDRPVPPEQLPVQRALRGDEVVGEEYDYVFPGGRRMVLLTSAAPIHDKRGRVAGAVCAFADITTLKTLQRELDVRRREAEEASVRKTRFLAAVSHDIRTPVNAINLLAEIIRRECAAAGPIPGLAQQLQANAHSLVELVSDVLDLARFDSGKVELQESEFLLNDLLAEECRQVRPLAENKGLTVAVRPPERPVWLYTDRVKLGRVLGNLLANAIKFTADGGVVAAASVGEDRRPVLRVTDTGVGIAPEHRARIFDEFAQVRNPERDPTKGTGLGLAICKRLVEVMGGTLAVESRVDVGSTFTVTLPPSAVVLRLDATLEPAAPPPAPAPARSNRLSGLRVLLVEDHPTTRTSVSRLLRAEGAAVTEAPDGQSALAAIRRGGMDVILLDMMLPDLDGREILRALQAERPGGLRAVLVLTGDLTSQRLDDVQRLGADAVIGKPIDVSKLMDTLERLRDTPQGERPA